MIKFILIFWVHTSYIGANGSSVPGAAIPLVQPVEYGSVEQCLAAAESPAGRAYAEEHEAFAYTCSLGGK
jgi:hypothetical protein